jgi:hypothetical protein
MKICNKPKSDTASASGDSFVSTEGSGKKRGIGRGRHANSRKGNANLVSKKPIGVKKRNAKPQLQGKAVSLGRHRTNCTVCAHEQCAEIEAEFVNWKSPVLIATEFGLADRTSIYRHAHAFGLMGKRRRNVRAALERMIEKSGDVDVTASAIVGAIQAYAKINAQGQWVDRNEQVNLNELFERMTCEELETYAREGALPDWFSQAVTATPFDSQEVKNDD